MVKSFKIRFLVGILTISVLLMVFCLPAFALESEQYIYTENALFNSKSKATMERFGSVSNVFAYGNTEIGSSATNTVNVQQTTLSGSEIGYYRAKTYGTAKKITTNKINGRYQNYFNLRRQTVNTTGIYEIYNGLTGDVMGDIYFWVYTIIIIDDEVLLEAPNGTENPNGIILPEVETNISYQSAGVEYNKRVNFDTPWNQAAATKIEVGYTKDWKNTSYDYGNQTIIKLTTCIRTDFDNIMPSSFDDDISIYINNLYIDYDEQLKFLTKEENLSACISTQQVGVTSSAILYNTDGQTQEIVNIGDIFYQEQNQLIIDIQNVKDEMNMDSIDDVINSEAYATVKNMYHSLWEFGALELMMILTVGFALLSFVLFGKKG